MFLFLDSIGSHMSNTQKTQNRTSTKVYGKIMNLIKIKKNRISTHHVGDTFNNISALKEKWLRLNMEYMKFSI